MTQRGGATLGLGTATFIPGYGLAPQGRPDVSLLRRAVNLGIRYIDTAAAYGDGEAALANLADVVDVHDVRVCTKIQPAVRTAEAFVDAGRASLSRLRRAQVDTMMLHSVLDGSVADAGLRLAWQGLKSEGMARWNGVSTYGTEPACLAASEPWCDVLQIEYSILNQSVLRALPAGSRPEVVVRSVLCKGLLTADAVDGSLPAEVAATVGELSALAGDLGMDLATLAIRFALDSAGVDVVIIGIADEAQLDSAIAAWKRAPLTVEQWTHVAGFDRSRADWSHPERWPAGRLTA